MLIEPAVPVGQRGAEGLQSRRQHQVAVLIGTAQQGDDLIAPHRHDQAPFEIQRLPRTVIVGEPASGDRQMYMGVPFEISPKGVKRGENTR